MSDLNPSQFPFTQRVLEIWKGRQILTSRQFKNLADEYKGQSGRLWEVYNTRFVQEIYDLIGKSASEGLTYKDFKEQANAILAKYGNVSVLSGGQFSSSYADIVIRTNTQQLYAAGKYSQMFSAKRIQQVPYVLYNAVNDQFTRPAHAALDGKVFRKDDLAARYLYPPSDYRCRCSLIELDQDEFEEGGYKVTGGNELLDKTFVQDGTEYTIAPAPGWRTDRVASLVPNVLKGS